MEGIAPLLRAERRAKRAFAARVKQGVSSLSTVAYAAVAGGLYEPLFQGHALRVQHVAAIFFSVTAIFWCIYAAPFAELDDERV